MKIFNYDVDYIAIGTALVSGIIIFFKKLVIDIIYDSMKNSLIRKKEKINKELDKETKDIINYISKRKPPKSIREAEIIAIYKQSQIKTKKRELELREEELRSLKELYEKEKKIEIKINKLNLKK